jgi:hypothetical protein
VTTDLRNRGPHDARGRDRSWGIDDVALDHAHDARRAPRWVHAEQASSRPRAPQRRCPATEESLSCL